MMYTCVYQKVLCLSPVFGCIAFEMSMVCLLTEAGAAFVEVANLQNRLQSRHECASQLVEAANCYKKCNVDGRSSRSSFGPACIFYQVGLHCVHIGLPSSQH